MINSTQRVEEPLGNQLTFVQTKDGTIYVPLKRLCESLGIDYDRQRSKVRNSKQLKAELMPVPGTDGRHREMLCLPVAVIGDWASTIDRNTVPPEVLDELRGYLEDADEVSESPDENQGATADSGMAAIATEKERKERAYNCLGNTSDFLDQFMIWIGEMINYGDYFPRDDVRKAPEEEVQDFVRRTRCNVRVLQAIVDAGRRYQELDDGITEEGLMELHKEVWDLYESVETLIGELCDDHFDLVAADHPALKYLSKSGLETLTDASVQIRWDFDMNIIPPAGV